MVHSLPTETGTHLPLRLHIKLTFKHKSTNYSNRILHSFHVPKKGYCNSVPYLAEQTYCVVVWKL